LLVGETKLTLEVVFLWFGRREFTCHDNVDDFIDMGNRVIKSLPTRDEAFTGDFQLEVGTNLTFMAWLSLTVVASTNVGISFAHIGNVGV
jgi:hypothetical protein